MPIDVYLQFSDVEQLQITSKRRNLLGLKEVFAVHSNSINIGLCFATYCMYLTFQKSCFKNFSVSGGSVQWESEAF